MPLSILNTWRGTGMEVTFLFAEFAARFATLRC